MTEDQGYFLVYVKYKSNVYGTQKNHEGHFLEMQHFLYFHSFWYSLIYDYYFEFEFLLEQRFLLIEREK
jgi:hypothetical protein